ncbi:MAG: NADH-quinone oxidoreductase subunit L, partial [Proteobacteria bacterium]|nr:NADH-quinone oxidoreductase subunit L [Pseudomonadota bacterium]
MLSIENIALFIIFSPLFICIFTRYLGSCVSKTFSSVFASIGISITAALSWYLFLLKLNNQDDIIHITITNWFNINEFSANWALYIDSITILMMVVVLSVSALVHIYSIGYMRHDNAKGKFMSYLSLFTFFMLILISADNFAQLFVGWEGVGLSSYLLINFWFHKPSANNAATKAFLVNRVGDVGLALGVFLIAYHFGTLEYKAVFTKVENFSNHYISILGFKAHTITVICLLLFIGCMGKSAQLGLHVWLPDAMEGPTPVSALIHAATMVTAGVFLLARCSMLFEYSEFALNVITIIGSITCIFAATIAVTQSDIKKIIAYSTCSQLGYMFFSCGVSAYSAALFHLFTHAFFKALLFLGAGNVIHATLDEQNIFKMGGLARKIKITYAFFWIGSLALAGIPPFAGFFSKDAILEAAYAKGEYMAYFFGIVAAFLTAFYSWRLIFVVFHGNSNISHEQSKKIHEAEGIMIFPLIFLAVGSIAFGAIGALRWNMESAASNFWNNAI